MINANVKDVDIAYLERDDPDKMPIEDLLRVHKWLSS
jgi:hypothetical protein